VLAKRILILGGTAEARILAGLLLQHGYEPISSLAGVTTNPHRPPGQVRQGGFGGAAGLARYCEDDKIAAIIDATHPFAARISRHAFEAAQMLSIPLARLERPGWEEQPSDRWLRVADIAAAVNAVAEQGRVLLTIGRKEAGAFFRHPRISGIARMIEPPAEAAPPNWTVRLSRPPFVLSDERDLIKAESIGCLVCKDAGGDSTRAKLDAARECGVPVVMFMRPIKPCVPTALSPDAVMALTETLLRT
jgi:precorrin-6A/cobalt-precorrin-6A reductase